MPLFRLIYFSQNQIDVADASIIRQLDQIRLASNSNNQPLGLTGALVFDSLWFLQALEGSRENVWRTYHRIEQDERHSDLVVVEASEVPTRLFGNWWMGVATRSAATESAFVPFLKNGLLRPDDMKAKDILDLMIKLSSIGFSRRLAPAA